jgi:hypothetical protein
MLWDYTRILNLFKINYTKHKVQSMTQVSAEGPRSRRYGRTAAMRLIVQPYDEDEDDDYYFLSFS